MHAQFVRVHTDIRYSNIGFPNPFQQGMATREGILKGLYGFSIGFPCPGEKYSDRLIAALAAPYECRRVWHPLVGTPQVRM